MRAYRFRIYPNQEQEKALENTLTTCRHLYNSALAERIAAYKESGKSLSYVEQANALSANKNDWQKQVHSQVLQDTLKRLDKSFRRFFDALKTKKRCGFPRFKPMQRYHSFCYPQSGFKLTDNRKHITLSKIGKVKVRCHREIEGKVKTCALVKDIDEWFVVLTVENPLEIMSVSQPDSVIGIDVGISAFATLSNGESIPNPRHLKRSEKQLSKLQRHLSRKKKGSNNRNKQRLRVAKCHRAIKRQRNDFLHKVSHQIATTHGTIVFEKLNIKGMMRNHKLAKHIADASWNRLIEFTTYKAESAGGVVQTVNPKGTSQICSKCGCIVKKGLSVRVHDCPHCGVVLDRDHNAALNIKDLAVGITDNQNACGRLVRLPSTSVGEARAVESGSPIPLWVG
jgi:putative transposase